MKLVKVTDQEELGENIPLEALQFVSYLNRIVMADPEAVTQLLDHAVVVNAKALEEGFPHLVVRDGGHPDGKLLKLSGLGLISGFTNTARYRVYAEFQNDDPPYGIITHFGWFRVEE